MKNIKVYCPSKYDTFLYEKVEDGIYLMYPKYIPRHINPDRPFVSLTNLTDREGWNLNEDGLYEKELKENVYLYLTKEDYDNNNMLNPFGNVKEDEKKYVTSLMFEPEPDLGENSPTAPFISQYPLEDVLDKFGCSIEDEYTNENESDSVYNYQEFSSLDINHIRNLLSIVGKHVYNKEEDGHIKLVIE